MMFTKKINYMAWTCISLRNKDTIISVNNLTQINKHTE